MDVLEAQPRLETWRRVALFGDNSSIGFVYRRSEQRVGENVEISRSVDSGLAHKGEGLAESSITAAIRKLPLSLTRFAFGGSLAMTKVCGPRALNKGWHACTVFGSPAATIKSLPAAAGKLFIVAAGEPKTVQACQPLFNALGQHTFVIANEPPKANLVKLSGNFLIAAVIETLGEAFALVSKAGIDRAKISRHSHQHAVRSACIQNLWRDHRRGALRASRFQGEAGLQGHPFGPWSGGSFTGTHARCEPPPRPLPGAASHRCGRSRLVCAGRTRQSRRGRTIVASCCEVT